MNLTARDQLTSAEKMISIENNQYYNQLEPPSLIHSFLCHSPENFKKPEKNIEMDEKCVAFETKFDLMTTLDPKLKKFLQWSSPLWPKIRTLFVGCTTSEYALFPTKSDPLQLASTLQMSAKHYPLTVIKDLPLDSPLLTLQENNFNQQLIEHLRNLEFCFLSGEALAYVPMDFSSLDAYFQKLSHARRHDMRRKLKKQKSIQVDHLQTGVGLLGPEKTSTEESEHLIRELYQLYLNVFNQSQIHFDKLTLSFFTELLTTAGGELFLYRPTQGQKILGFNLCFIYRGSLVDKYIGLSYPEAYDYSLYFLSWFYNIEFCLHNKLNHYIAGWTDPEVKRSLGASFTFTHHGVYFKNAFLRKLTPKVTSWFEADKNLLAKTNEMNTMSEKKI